MGKTQSDHVRFILDDALGHLLKRLRILGFDAIFLREYKKKSLEKEKPHEIHLTQSRSNDDKATGKTVHLKPGPVSTQLHEALSACGMDVDHFKPFTRCIRCNQEIRHIDKVLIRGQVPDYVWETHETFRECPSCHRIYWRGTHADRIGKTIQKIINGHKGNTLYHENTKTRKKEN